MKQKNKKGFTLVELSIVLVIIGLLIGGILVGQSLIESAKMQSFIRQVGQYDAAVAVFQDKFGNLPGDNNLFSTACTTCVLGDGVIQSADAVATEFNSEIGAFWSDLGSSGLKNEEKPTTVTSGEWNAVRTDTTTAPVLNQHVPQAKIGTSTGIYGYGVGGKNYFFLGTNSTNTLAFGTTSGSLKPADALAVDTKIDNGIPNTGNVVAQAATVGTLPVAADYTTTTTMDGTPSATECYLTASTYNASVATDYCKLSIRMGSSTGVLY
jgi:prepilin-type N-terminal cleavage/methylation domain-containing protein